MKKMWEILVIILLNLMLLCAAGDERASKIFTVSQPAFSSLGDTSAEVEQIQQRLRQLGYYSGEVNGFFSLATRYALKNYQNDFLLEPNGKADEETLRSLSIITDNNTNLTDADYELLCRFAASQCGKAKRYKVMSELKKLDELSDSGAAPESLAALIFQRGRFDCVAENRLSDEPTEQCRCAVFFLFG